MNQLISHIEFLLHDHDCVIIPDFGGFVVNTIPPQKDGIAVFHAPVCELVFNRDLTHNDGLLAQSYLLKGAMSFDAAMQKVEDDVRLLKRQLRELRRVDMGKLGIFELHDDNRFIYIPGVFVRPALFGLTQATLKPLIQIQPVLPVRKKQQLEHRWNRPVSIAGAIAAVVLLMFLLPLGDTPSIGRQSAQMISETGWMQSKSSQRVNTAEITDNDDSPLNMENNQPLNIVDKTNTSESIIIDEVVPEESPKYYIIMGVYTKLESAQKSMDFLLGEGFHQAGRLERPNRIDVYAASFSDKTAAEVYLREVHKKFPTHADAWILKK